MRTANNNNCYSKKWMNTKMLRTVFRPFLNKKYSGAAVANCGKVAESETVYSKFKQASRQEESSYWSWSYSKHWWWTSLPIQAFGWWSFRRTSKQRASRPGSRWTHVQLAVSSLPVSATTADRHSLGLDIDGHLPLSLTSSSTPHSVL